MSRNFCIDCWTLACACTSPDDKQKRLKLTNDYGCSGMVYKKGESCPLKREAADEEGVLPKGRQVQIVEHYQKLVNEYRAKI